MPVMATCGIRPPDKASENIYCRHLPLFDSEEEEYNLTHSSARLRKRAMFTVHGILTFI
jgi:hypothetical protein